MPKSDDWLLELRSRLSPYTTLVFAGLAKNAGKTTALNAVNRLFPGQCLGLTSIGYDGETFDAIYRHPKPSITVHLGQIILTAERFLPDTPKGYDILEAWGNHPQFGSWLILKITEPGDFRMAGPSALSELLEGISRLRQHGATRIHVDGALNRLSHISVLSWGSDRTKEAVALDRLKKLKGGEKIERAVNQDMSVILSTGAALGNSLKEVTERSLNILELLQLPTFSPGSGFSIGSTSQDVFINHNAFFEQGAWFPLPCFLWNQDVKSLIPPQVEAVYVKGALTDSFYLALRTAGRLPRQFIVRTPAHILLSPNVWNGLKSRGIEVKLLERPQLAMLTLSSWHPITPISTERIAEALLPHSTVPLVDIQKQQVWLP
ncbi:hypothetical protein [Desulfosporosinus sp. BICA1-9]|uniref:hypothetical protein n=1 Tax=Desulfosporosinus sp. BICA1-9 TaxID=1531958 RepID=UPI00054BC1FA|nr:hypothetical protein [Desulfosporosinus sp. BICA1-9]KJS49423.1 MAG: hypothetical protein VR66_08545 [Peptococcaceae bacterium BRH_c23]KJS79996.1 MAG: hypothetical protein JL57_28960 [Desulfosporosinus sp. BICA1-9]HBW33993.1 hypothetical protein [Desulfosporosinus sp.]